MRSSRPGAAHSGVCPRLYDAAGLRAFRGAKPLRRLPLHRGRAESETRFYLRLPLRAAAAAFARRGFAPRAPPDRRDHREERGDLVRPRTGQIHSRASAFDGRRTDDAAVDEARARLLDRAADLARALRRDRVGVDVDSAESEACDLARERERAVRRTHRKNDVGRAERALERAQILDSRGSGARARRGAAAIRRPHDPQPARNEAGADRGAHFAGMKHGDGVHGVRRLGARAGQCPGVMIWIWWRLTLRKGALMSLRSPISHTSASVTAIKSFASTM